MKKKIQVNKYKCVLYVGKELQSDSAVKFGWAGPRYSGAKSSLEGI